MISWYLSYVFRKQKYRTSKLPGDTDDIRSIHLFLLICITAKFHQKSIYTISKQIDDTIKVYQYIYKYKPNIPI